MGLFFSGGGQAPIASHRGIGWDRYSIRPVLNPQGRFYTYAPSIVVAGATEHIWSCQNATEGTIRDHIYYTRRHKGVVVESHSVLPPGPTGAWDSYHVCDPSVVKSRVVYNRVAYDYLMFYLGNDVDASRHNQIGVAFAQKPSGPWLRYPHPIVACADTRHWGVGQPSAVPLDNRGRILLFYTQGDAAGTRAYRREIKMEKMAQLGMGEAISVTTAGLTGTKGAPDWVNNFDVVYDPRRNRFFAVREQHPYPTSHPNYIGSSLQIVSIESASIWRGGGRWRIEGAITPDLVGFPRNHNGGFKRTAQATLPNPNRVSVVFARSCADGAEFGCTTPEWSYDLWEIAGTL